MDSRTAQPHSRPTSAVREWERLAVDMPARLTWKDQRGTTRFASVVARNVSELGVYVECPSPVSLPVYRLVQFQLERDVKSSEGLPTSFRHGRLTAAVYRVTPPDARGCGQGLALRLMVEPRRRTSSVVREAPVSVRATA